MNLDFLESFRVFSTTLNFTHAASARHISQPALHKQIQSLGQAFGIELYRRKGRILELTPAGVKMARFANELRDRVDRLDGQLKEGVAASTVTLAAGRGSLMYLLGDALRVFTDQHPGRVRVMTTNQSETLGAVRSGEAHLGVTVLNEIPEDLEVTLLYELTPRLVVSDDHPYARRRSIGLKMLDGLPLICPPKPSPMREMVSGWLHASGLRFNPVMDAEGWELLLHFASLGFGAAVVNGCCRRPSGTVSIRLPDLPKTRYYLLGQRDEYAFPELEWMRKCVLKHAKKPRMFE